MKYKNDIFSVDKPEDSTGFLLWQVTNLWQRKIRQALEKYQLTHAQFVLLASMHWFELHNKEVTQILLSTHTKIDPMTTSTVLRTLETKKLIKRKEHSIDTRAKTIFLTEEGTKISKQAIKIVEKFDTEFFHSLGNKTSEFNKKLLSLLKET